MPKGILRYLAAGVLVLGTLVVAPATAQADAATIPVNSSGSCSPDWYVNNDGDENTRLPSQTEDGLKFVGNQLAHHAPEQTITLNNLNPGTFEASPAPSLSSFFSVEIANPDGSAYATLRYDSTEGKWFIGGARADRDAYQGHEANPVEFVGKKDNWGTIAVDAKVLSFGVGYVKSPGDGTETTVGSVTFAGKTYDLTCKPAPFVPSTVAVTKVCRWSKTDKRTVWTVKVGGPRNREVWAWIWSPNPHPGQDAKGYYHLPNGKGSYQMKVGNNTIVTGWGGGLLLHYYDGAGNLKKVWKTSNAKVLC